MIVQSDEDKSDNDEIGQENEDSHSSFYTLKRNLEDLIKKYPRLLTAQVLLLVQFAFLFIHCLLTTCSPGHDVIAGQEWANSD